MEGMMVDPLDAAPVLVGEQDGGWLARELGASEESLFRREEGGEASAEVRAIVQARAGGWPTERGLQRKGLEIVARPEGRCVVVVEDGEERLEFGAYFREGAGALVYPEIKEDGAWGGWWVSGSLGWATVWGRVREMLEPQAGSELAGTALEVADWEFELLEEIWRGEEIAEEDATALAESGLIEEASEGGVEIAEEGARFLERVFGGGRRVEVEYVRYGDGARERFLFAGEAGEMVMVEEVEGEGEEEARVRMTGLTKEFVEVWTEELFGSY